MVAAATIAAAAVFASLSTLSASLMYCVDRPGMLRKWAPPELLRLGVIVDQVVVGAGEDREYGDSSDIELLREGMESGCK